MSLTSLAALVAWSGVALAAVEPAPPAHAVAIVVARATIVSGTRIGSRDTPADMRARPRPDRTPRSRPCPEPGAQPCRMIVIDMP